MRHAFLLLALSSAPLLPAAPATAAEPPALAQNAPVHRPRPGTTPPPQPRPGPRYTPPAQPQPQPQPHLQQQQGDEVTVPVDVSVGPAFHFVTGPVQADEQTHYGLKLDIKAIIDNATIRANIRRVPQGYRATAIRMKEYRMGVSSFIPDTLFISPQSRRTGMYGIAFRPLYVGLTLWEVPRINLSVGALLTYAYISSTVAAIGAETTHLLRPGLDAKLDIEIPISRSFLVSFGWTSQLYVPQEIGGEFWAWGERDKSIWHIGQAYLMLHFRFPYTASL